MHAVVGGLRPRSHLTGNQVVPTTQLHLAATPHIQKPSKGHGVQLLLVKPAVRRQANLASNHAGKMSGLLERLRCIVATRRLTVKRRDLPRQSHRFPRKFPL